MDLYMDYFNLYMICSTKEIDDKHVIEYEERATNQSGVVGIFDTAEEAMKEREKFINSTILISNIVNAIDANRKKRGNMKSNKGTKLYLSKSKEKR